LLDELIIAGELQESSKKAVLRVCAAQDALMEEGKDKDEGLYQVISNSLFHVVLTIFVFLLVSRCRLRIETFTVYKKYRPNHYE
jgi:hypothetical protein